MGSLLTIFLEALGMSIENREGIVTGLRQPQAPGAGDEALHYAWTARG